MQRDPRDGGSDAARSPSGAPEGQVGWGLAAQPAGLLPRIGWHAAIVYVAFALMSLLLFGTSVGFRGVREGVLQATPWLLLGAIALGLLLVLAARFLGRTAAAAALCSRHGFALAVLGSTAALFAGQLAIVQGALFITDWDVIGMTGSAWDEAVLEDNRFYFSLYPNQLFLLTTFRAIVALSGASDFVGAYSALVVGGCLCISASCALMAFAARRLAGPRAAYLAYGLCVLLAGLSPWMLVPYSDSYGMLCPTAVLFSYACLRRMPLRWGCATFFGLVGYFIKPTAIFALVAVAFVEVATVVPRWWRAHRAGASARASGAARRVAATAAAVVLAGTAAFALDHGATDRYDFLDPSLEITSAHYLMLGANDEANGRFNQDDIAFSTAIEGKAERQAANLRVWRERIADLGPMGVAWLAVKKTVNNYLDGAFWWEGEGDFYREVVGGNQPLKDYFNIGYEKNWKTNGEGNPTPFFHIAQMVWLFALAGIVACWTRRGPLSCGAAAVGLAILMLSLFLVVFECRARYLFLYVPYFCLMAALGWQGVARLVASRWPVRSEGVAAG